MAAIPSIDGASLYASFLEHLEADRGVVCPFCEKAQDLSECHNLITYHGEGAAQEFECQSCERVFWVQEQVHRAYEVSRTQPL